MIELEAFLNFSDISGQIHFKDLLNFLNIPITKETAKEIKGETNGFKFIISKKNNIFFSPNNDSIKGSVINFYSEYKGINLRDSAKFLQESFLGKPVARKREIPNLELQFCKELEDKGFSKEFCAEKKFGLVKQKSILTGKIAFHISDDRGYIGYDTKKESWFFPKGFKRDVLYDPNKLDCPYCILCVSTFDALHFMKLGFNYCVALMAKSATDEQIELLKRFKRILLFHPEPEAISLRLMPYCFCKAVKINSVGELDCNAIKAFF